MTSTVMELPETYYVVSCGDCQSVYEAAAHSTEGVTAEVRAMTFLLDTKFATRDEAEWARGRHDRDWHGDE